MKKARKVALITGAARRIGAQIAETLHRNGMNIVIHYHHSRKEARVLCDKLNKARPDSAIMLPANLLKVSDIKTLAQKALAYWKRLDVLVNNASAFYKTHVGKVTEKEWEELLNCNLKAPFFLSQALASHLKKQQGCIVNITDIHAQNPLEEYPVYSISKAGLVMLTQSLALELAPEVRVNAVAPGLTLWPEGKNALSNKIKKSILKRIPLKQEGHPGYIAEAVWYLINHANYVTGETIAVDGGRLLFN